MSSSHDAAMMPLRAFSYSSMAFCMLPCSCWRTPMGHVQAMIPTCYALLCCALLCFALLCPYISIYIYIYIYTALMPIYMSSSHDAAMMALRASSYSSMAFCNLPCSWWRTLDPAMMAFLHIHWICTQWIACFALLCFFTYHCAPPVSSATGNNEATCFALLCFLLNGAERPAHSQAALRGL